MSAHDDVLRLSVDLVRRAAALGIGLAGSSGLHATDVRALQALDAAAVPGGIPMRALADELGLTPPATTALIDRLEERDLARRERDPGDRRVIRVVPGPAARTFGEQHLRPLAERLGAATAALSESEAAAVARFLAAAVGEPGEPGEPGDGDAGDGRHQPAPLPSRS